ncbi:MAG: hypothetical protein ACLFRX_01895 [Gemmatimonadota bacterium]
MKLRMVGLALVALLGASEARAQWDAPAFLPPRPGDDIGIYLSDIADFGIQGIWRQHGNLNLGVRAGYIDTAGDGIVLVGVETWGLIYSAPRELPVDVTWTLGAGATFDGGTLLEIPLGLSIGRVVPLEALTLQLYGHPRLGLFIYSNAADDLEMEFDGLFDLGAEAVLNENLKLRLAATFGDVDTIGLGLAFRWSRGAVVR